MTGNKKIDSSPMLLCIDLETGSEALAEYAVRRAKACGNVIHILHVAQRTLDQGALEHCRAKVDRLVAPHVRDGVAADSEILTGTAEESIPALARELDAALIVLGRRHRSGVDRIYVGSTTSAVISEAPCPVLVVPLTPDHLPLDDK